MKVQIEKTLLKSLMLMTSFIEARDAYTGGHLWRVSQYSQKLAEAAGLSSEMVFLASLGGFLHDIGKISIPDGILSKRGKLTETEYEVVKTHPGIGAVLIQEHPLGNLALEAVHEHHEWVNGIGYPNRLHGEQISIYARIVSIADAFDAITSTRPYRRESPPQMAMEALRREQSLQFDSKLLDVFIELIQKDALNEIIGSSELGVPLVHCANCGPVITVPPNTQDGDIAICRICGTRHRLHRRGDAFEVEPTGEKGTADQLKPRPERSAIEAFVAQAPLALNI